MRAKSGAAYVAAHVRAANKKDPYNGTDLPRYTPGQHCPVTLPSRGPDSGWKAGTAAEWHEAFCYDPETGECELLRDEWYALKKLHMDAHYAGGCVTKDCTNVKDTIAMFMKNGLACTPWLKSRHFWGLKNSVKQARARTTKVLKDSAQERHEVTLERVFEMLDELPPADLTHYASYNLEAIKVALSEAVGRDDFEIPTTLNDLLRLLPKLLDRVGVCPDCLIEKFLIILEHAKDGPDAGRVRSRDCHLCNTGGRSFTDLLIAVAHALAETLTAGDHARVTELTIAHARPGQATRGAKERLAKAQRLAAAATVEADEDALAHVSTTRLRAADDDADDAYQARRAAAIEAEQVMQEERSKSRAAAAAQREGLPPVRVGTRVVVKKTGARGVVQGTTGSGAWIHVELDKAPGTTKGYRPSHLDIDTSRKPSARKPSARKPAAKKPSKKKARK